MERRRKITLLAGGGAALTGSGALLARVQGEFAGLPADFWRGVPIGMGASFVVAAAIMVIAKRPRRDPGHGG